MYYNTIYVNIMQVAGNWWSEAGGRHLVYLWLPTPHGPVETIGLVSQQQAGERAHGRTRYSGEGLLQEKAHHQQQPSFPPLSQSGIRPGGGASRATLVGDINYIKLRWKFVYLAVLVHVFTRCIRGWGLGRSLSQELTQATLQQALAQHTPGTHHSGQRVQYAATAYVQLLEEPEVQISMAE
jgi:transposase InsO family protein